MRRHTWIFVLALVLAGLLSPGRGDAQSTGRPDVPADVTGRLEPTRIGFPPAATPQAVRAGGAHSLALDANGDAWAWGSNHDGQLGDGSVVDAFQPTRVAVPQGVRFTSVQAGWRHSLALDANGDAWAWGRNGNGQLGDGTTSDRYRPTRVVMPPGVRFTGVQAGGHHSLALDHNGAVWAWGANGDGQLGDGTTTDRTRPVQVAAPPGVTFTRVHAGWRHSLALDDDGNAWAWGHNDAGQLGDGGDGPE